MSKKPAYPRKLFYRINEAASIIGVEPYVLRYWETRFPMLKPERFGNDQRRYRQEDIELLLVIRELLYVEKFTIDGAIERLKRERAAEAAGDPLPIHRPPIFEEEEPAPRRMPLPMQVDFLEKQAESAYQDKHAGGPSNEQLVALLRVIRAELEDLRKQLAG